MSAPTLYAFYRLPKMLGVSRAALFDILSAMKMKPIVEHRRRQYFSARQVEEIRAYLS